MRARGTCTALAAILATLSSGSLARAQAEVVRIDGVAAVVGGRGSESDSDVVLRSDVELRARIVLSGQRPEGTLPLGRLPEPLLAATMREIIGELLIAREAQRVATPAPNEEDVRLERQRLWRAAGGRARLSSLLTAIDADPLELERVARRRAVVAAFLRANLEGETVVTEAEVDRALAEAPAELEATDAARLRDAVRARIAREALDRTIARWVAVLGARTRVRIHVEYAGQ